MKQVLTASVSRLSGTSILLFLILACGERELPSDRTNPLFRGHVSIVDGRVSFRSCGADARFEIVETTGQIRDLCLLRTDEGGEDLYVVVRGQRESLPIEFTGEPFDARLRVSELSFAARESVGCDEDLSGLEFKAQGNEPFWNLEISGEGIVFSEIGNPEGRVFPYEPPDVRADVRSYESHTDGHVIRVEIRNDPCFDDMSGAFFSHRAVVTLDGKIYGGCAREGW